MSPADAELPGDFRQEDGPAWQRIRRYAVPGWMIEQATAHRLAGDWRAACAVAAVDVDFELSEVEARYGAGVAEAVAEDLPHLAPDLLRWHLPRLLGGRTTIAPDLRIVLASYGGPGGPALSVTTPVMTEGSQRLRLHCAPVVTERNKYTGRGFAPEHWTAMRPFWDARHAPELGARFADPDGLAERIAQLRAAGDTVGAYEAAGILCDLTVPPVQRYQRPADPEALFARLPADLTRIAPEVTRLAATGSGDRYRLTVAWPYSAVLEHTGPDALRARIVTQAEAASLPALPRYAWQRLPDLELVRTGRISPGELHPLVADALFPDAGPAVGPPGPRTDGRPVRVRCRGGWHEVRSRGGVLDLPHTPEEQQRERAMRAFGGAVSGCFAVQQSWTTGEGRLPRGLRAERQAFFLRVQHGDTPAVVALLDAGVDPRIRDGRHRGLLHALHLLDHEVLLPRLLAAGLDLEARDKAYRTPLLSAVHWGGSADLVRALLAAGSRIDVMDEMDLSVSQEIRRYKRTDLTFLRDRVDQEFPEIGADWFDEHMEYWENEDEDEDGDDEEEEEEGEGGEGDDA
ncbi:ankyrin repeat domain-containing protein [Streptomyces virginiae]|uniref:ankyrin repeat domain-containing protein n=1 Tax=Streptomyces virginiae TaxID=1961 RepID=UPI00225A4B57|nr:ankyrin repeat domain-containing protein [Streptomyces virginiae]MCX4717636.1 ankyrin repeat domain-containing protein [Streptomyces virginiae]